MTDQHLIVLLLKIFEPAAFTSITLWIAVYTRLAPWWRNELGRTFVFKSLVVAALLGLSVLSLFFNLNRQASLIVAWAFVALVALIPLVMVQRIAVFIRNANARKKEERPR